MLVPVLAVAGAVLALELIYRAMRTEWPDRYFRSGDGLRAQIARRPLAYALFRFGPLFVVSLFVGASLRNADYPAAVPVLLIGATHVCVRILPVAVQRVRTEPGPQWRLPVVAYGLIALGCIASSALALPFLGIVSAYVPSGSELTVSLWTAAFAAIAAAWLASITREKEDGHESRRRSFAHARVALGDHLWHRAAVVATEVHADPRLVHAVMIVETMQRPRWFRGLESRVAGLTRSGSTGPLQVQGIPSALDDESALEAAIRRRFVGQTPLDRTGELDRRWLGLFLRAYNQDSGWRDDVMLAYEWLDQEGIEPLASLDEHGPDGRPLIEVTKLFQQQRRVEISGTAYAELPTFQVVELSAERDALRYLDVAMRQGASRKDWTINFEASGGACE